MASQEGIAAKSATTAPQVPQGSIVRTPAPPQPGGLTFLLLTQPALPAAASRSRETLTRESR